MPSEFDQLAEKHIGADYQNMTPQQQLQYCVDQWPLDSVQREGITEGIKMMSDDEARGMVLEIMVSCERTLGESVEFCQAIKELQELQKELAKVRK